MTRGFYGTDKQKLEASIRVHQRRIELLDDELRWQMALFKLHKKERAGHLRRINYISKKIEALDLEGEK